MKLIIDIPEDVYEPIIKAYKKDKELQTRPNLYMAIANGIPLNNVKAEIADIYCGQYCENPPTADSVREMILDILNNIGKAESEVSE